MTIGGRQSFGGGKMEVEGGSRRWRLTEPESIGRNDEEKTPRGKREEGLSKSWGGGKERLIG